MSEAEAISDSELLMAILMLGAFVNTPMNDGVCVPTGISRNEIKIIMSLQGTGSMAGHDFVELIGMAPMNVSRSLRQLKERGWIEDVPDPENRRRKPVRLTAKGISACDQFQPDFEKLAEALVGSLTKPQKAQFYRATRKILANMGDWITSHHAEVQWQRPDK